MKPLTILAPLPDGPEAARLLQHAIACAGSGGRVIVLAVVVEGDDVGRTLNAARAMRRRLRRLAGEVDLTGVELQTRVRVARLAEEAVREAAREEQPDLLLLDGSTFTPREPAGDGWHAAMRRLAETPPCDALIARCGAEERIRSVLLPSRGGPTAELAFQVALGMAGRHGAPLTLLHVETPGVQSAADEQETRLFAVLTAGAAFPRLRTSTITAAAPREAIAIESRRHDVVILGAQAVIEPAPAADAGMATAPAGEAVRLGEVPRALLADHPGSVLVVKRRDPIDLTIFRPRPPALEPRVDTWFAESSFHCREFADVEDLAALKQRQGLTVSVAVMLHDQPGTLPGIARALAELQERHELIDETVVFSGPPDQETREIAAELSLPLRTAPIESPGAAAWQALQDLRGDLIVWLDADIRNPHPKLVYGLLGPLLRDERIQRVVGHYRLHGADGDSTLDDGLTQVTEYSVRPLINLFFPELSGVINPLSREYAVRRAALDGLRLVTGGGMELALLLDQYERAGLTAIAQVDLEERVGRPAPAAQLSRLAFDAVHILMRQVGHRVRGLGPAIHPAIKLIQEYEGRYQLNVIEADDGRTPPIGTRHQAPGTSG